MWTGILWKSSLFKIDSLSCVLRSNGRYKDGGLLLEYVLREIHLVDLLVGYMALNVYE